MAEFKSPHVVVCPFPAQGHVNAAMDLSKKLALLGVSVTFVCTDAYISSMTKQGFDAGGLPIRLQGLADGLPHDKNMTDTLHQIDALIRAMETMGPSLQDLITKLANEDEGGCHVSCVVYDFMLWWVGRICKELGTLAYIFYPMSSSFYAYTLHVPEFVSQGRLPLGKQTDLSDQTNMFEIPGFPALSITEVPDISWDPNPVCPFDFVLSVANRWRDADGVLVNTVYELEGEVMDKALRWRAPEMDIKAVGPVLPFSFLKGEMDRESKVSEDAERCLQWLDEQPEASVLYVAFGTIACISEAQAEEIAMGLEASEERFVWVVRIPGSEGGVEAAGGGMRRLLSGFEDRTAGRGLVLWELAPQRQILAHSATGGFMTHCGWNSTWESICKGVPMLCLPMFADQDMNAKWVAHVINAGLLLQRSGDSSRMVKRDEVERAVRQVLAATASSPLRRAADRVRDLATHAALHTSGSSYLNLQEFSRTICQH